METATTSPLLTDSYTKREITASILKDSNQETRLLLLSHNGTKTSNKDILDSPRTLYRNQESFFEGILDSIHKTTPHLRITETSMKDANMKYVIHQLVLHKQTPKGTLYQLGW